MANLIILDRFIVSSTPFSSDRNTQPTSKSHYLTIVFQIPEPGVYVFPPGLQYATDIFGTQHIMAPAVGTMGDPNNPIICTVANQTFEYHWFLESTGNQNDPVMDWELFLAISNIACGIGSPHVDLQTKSVLFSAASDITYNPGAKPLSVSSNDTLPEDAGLNNPSGVSLGEGGMSADLVLEDGNPTLGRKKPHKHNHKSTVGSHKHRPKPNSEKTASKVNTEGTQKKKRRSTGQGGVSNVVLHPLPTGGVGYISPPVFTGYPGFPATTPTSPPTGNQGNADRVSGSEIFRSLPSTSGGITLETVVSQDRVMRGQSFYVGGCVHYESETSSNAYIAGGVSLYAEVNYPTSQGRTSKPIFLTTPVNLYGNHRLGAGARVEVYDLPSEGSYVTFGVLYHTSAPLLGSVWGTDKNDGNGIMVYDFYTTLVPETSAISTLDFDCATSMPCLAAGKFQPTILKELEILSAIQRPTDPTTVNITYSLTGSDVYSISKAQYSISEDESGQIWSNLNPDVADSTHSGVSNLVVNYKREFTYVADMIAVSGFLSGNKISYKIESTDSDGGKMDDIFVCDRRPYVPSISASSLGNGRVKLVFDPLDNNPCRCQISCRAGSTETQFGDFFPTSRDKSIVLSVVESTTDPSILSFFFTDSLGASYTVSVGILTFLLPEAPTLSSETIPIDEDDPISAERPVIVYVAATPASISGFDIYSYVTDFSMERYISNDVNRKTFRDWTPVDELASPMVDSPLREGLSYGYRIRWRNNYGQTTEWSNWSVVNP